MFVTLSKQERDLLEKKNRKSVWKKIVIALSCVVVFCTTYALILPAITLGNDLFLRTGGTCPQRRLLRYGQSMPLR